MISAGLVLTKIFGTRIFGRQRLGRDVLIDSSEVGALRQCAERHGQTCHGLYGPVALGAVNQNPLLSRYHVPWSANTSQLVFTANDKPDVPAGVSHRLAVEHDKARERIGIENSGRAVVHRD